MIIEYLGVCGVGKTTITAKKYEKLCSNGIKVEWPRYEMYETNSWLYRNLKKSNMGLLFAVTEPIWCKGLFVWLGLHERISISERWKLLFNGISLAAMREACRDNRVCYLFDEGVVQYLLGVLFRAEIEPEEEELDYFFSLFSPPEQLFVVNADNSIVEYRLNRRKRKTILSYQGKLSQNITLMRIMQDRIICYLEEKYMTSIKFVKND